MKILVTGATGSIGPRVVCALHKAGHKIQTFSVDAPTEGMFPQGVGVIIGDINNKYAVQSATIDIDAVVHMAALLHVENPPLELRRKHERVNVQGTSMVVEKAIKSGVERIVLFSTIAVYGPSEGRVLNELSPTNPNTLYAETKLAAERIVLKAKNKRGQPIGTVLRLGAVYGPRVKGNYAKITKFLARHCFIPLGNGENRRTLVYDKDVGQATALAVSHPSAAGMIFNVTDGKTHSVNEIIVSICEALGRKPPCLSLPVGLIKAVVRWSENGIRRFGLKPPITLDIINKYIEDIAVEGSLIQMKLGYKPQYELKEGWAETIREVPI